MSKVLKDIKLHSIKDLYEEAMENEANIDGNYQSGEIKNVSISDLHTFKNHPFKVIDDEKMEELVESIKEKGILSPAIVRKRNEGGYELISGHRRKRACELAGISEMPVIVRKLEDDEATILMVDANIQRENILPSERAKSLKMKYDVYKRQGKRTDLTSGHNGPKLASDIVGEEEGISARQVKRYIRLNNLIDPLLDLADEKKLGLVQAVDLSFIDKTLQEKIYEIMNVKKVKINTKQSEILKNESNDGSLTEDRVYEILVGKHEEKRKVILNDEELHNFFPDIYSEKEIKEIIMKLLEDWKERYENV